MSIDQVIDLFHGDEASKREFKLAYQKAFKFKIKIFIGLFICFIPMAYYSLLPYYGTSLFEFFNAASTSHFPITLSDHVSFIMFAFVPALVFSMFAGNYWLHHLTRHLKITLPESIAPKIEFRSAELHRRQCIDPNDHY